MYPNGTLVFWSQRNFNLRNLSSFEPYPLGCLQLVGSSCLWFAFPNLPACLQSQRPFFGMPLHSATAPLSVATCELSKGETEARVAESPSRAVCPLRVGSPQTEVEHQVKLILPALSRFQGSFCSRTGILVERKPQNHQGKEWGDQPGPSL